MTFINRNFLLSNETAKHLYNDIASKMPIIDYHCHVDAKEIAEDKNFTNITELWLYGDHYKWRAMRSCGIDEKYITGDASDYLKFKAFASIMPDLIGNPIYHWSHLELHNYFDCDLILCEENADEIWKITSEKLLSGNMSVRDLIIKSNVTHICTTNDPLSDLIYHKQIKEDDSFNIKVLPAIRPDPIINCEIKGFSDYILKLSKLTNIKIKNIKDLKQAIIQRLDFFADMGCRTADHGIDTKMLYKSAKCQKDIEDIFEKAMRNADISKDEEAIYKTEINKFLATEYAKRGWVMQFHFGVLRNVSEIRFKELGRDKGFDVIGTDTGIENLTMLLSHIEKECNLPKIILYSINPSDNAAIGALIGAFQNSSDSMPKIMQGSAWWFNDNESGMREQLTSLSNLSALGKFIGMLTDSRSFLSYTRHEYFRRILCDLIGAWVESGRYPNDEKSLKRLIENICYNNTQNFFGF